MKAAVEAATKTTRQQVLNETRLKREYMDRVRDMGQALAGAGLGPRPRPQALRAPYLEKYFSENDPEKIHVYIKSG